MGIMDIVDWVAKKATKYKDLIKLGTSASKAYLDYKDAKRKGELQEAAYADYMREAAAAGEEAQAAVDLGLTPMTITDVPETKADVSSFTKLAARGGLMSIPNRQRKRYATGPDEVDVMEFDEEVITPDYLMKEEGVNIGPMASGKYSQEEIEAYENYKYEMNEQKPGFPIMEIDEFLRFWYSAVKGEENKKMASNPEDFMTTNEMQIPDEEIMAMIGAQQAAKGGIIGLRHGGRARYESGTDWIVKKSDVEEEQVPRMGRAGQAAPEKLDWFQDLYLDREGGGGRDFMIPEKYKNLLDNDDERFNEWNRLEAKKETFESGAGKNLMNEAIRIMDKAYDIDEELHAQINNEFLEIVNSGDAEPGEAYYYIIKKYGDLLEMKKGGIAGLKKGGRVKRDNGGIMNLGGLEKDYRTTGGFVPIGAYEKKDDVPARLSKNEFVMTADAVRAAGGGSINKGAQRMYNTMKHLEAQPQAKRMTA